ncbi:MULTISPECIES: zinc ribbon-containing protein [unclassified Campylobacter]|uniref:zinc ribbon-containing protein n=1 Tax=unclassified Campylobacter TaxID=2593542 RepID=UPI001DE40B17|nr:zinc ribbon-containing protein [Campylobacter sp. RM12651]MBZ7983682.1 hypothetical protein [Campylobacter sp. RM12647]MBZ7993483.1 hypothetical protein [Campylobacter sp. RM9333]ULO03508.1 hypothetical protein AVBRAN_1049 [Campylobacter sp. RM12651]
MKKNNIPIGSDVSSGTYKCTVCGYKLPVQSVTSLPPCPLMKVKHPRVTNKWDCLSGVGDAPKDPYPTRK